MSTKATDIHDLVRERYGAIARERGEGSGCCGPATTKAAIGYAAEELAVAGEANLGLGCGNPLALAAIAPGMAVLDLGSGAGFDAFLARERVGATGRVIGVDMTDDMLALARENATRRGYDNVEFRKGMIEALPVEDASVDMVISNCVVNLSPDKTAVFREIARVLRRGGRFAISDIVLLKPLPSGVADSVAAYVGCVAGASLLSDYVALALGAGLADLAIPQIISGGCLLESLAPEVTTQAASLGFSGDDVRELAASMVSVKLHGRKASSDAKVAASATSAACCGQG